MGAEYDAVIIGAGAAGLAAAHEFRARGFRVQVLEAAARAGGALQSGANGGFTFDRGASAMRLTGPALDVLQRAGVANLLQRALPASRARFVLARGGLLPVPQNPWALLRTKLLPRISKVRLLAEPLIPPGGDAAESAEEFIARRFGVQTARWIAAPILTGIYGGNAAQLGADAVFPQLVEYERAEGSVAAGALQAALARARKRGKGGDGGRAGSYSAAGGLGALAQALAAKLGPNVIRTGARARAIAPTPYGVSAGGRAATAGAARWRAEYSSAEGGGELRARALLLALPAPAAADLLRPLDAEAGALCAQLRHASMVTLALAVDAAAMKHAPAGFGFLVPDAMDVKLLGALFLSRAFAGRAPPGQELLLAMLGGARWPQAADAHRGLLLQVACEGVSRALGAPCAAALRLLACTRWPQALVQPGPGHVQHLQALRRRLAGFRRLDLAGAWMEHGVAVGGALASGRSAARRLMGELE